MSCTRRHRARLPGLAAPLLAACVVALTLVVALALAGCGGGGTGDGGGSPPPSHSPSPGMGTVLVVVPDTDFQQTEYEEVWTALGDAGFPARIANAEGGDSASGDVHVRADLKIGDARAIDYVGLVLVGGPGAAALFENRELQALVRDSVAADQVVSAICLAPVVLANAGVLKDKTATVWPDEAETLEEAGCAVLADEPVVTDGRIITGNGPEAAHEFAAAVVKALQAND